MTIAGRLLSLIEMLREPAIDARETKSIRRLLFR
jgi:hypothetical protein